MNEGKDYTLDEKMKAISLTEEGIEKAKKSFRCWEHLYGKGHKICPSFGNGDKSPKPYSIKIKNMWLRMGIIIVDEFTGRMMPGRRWSEGLHQAVEAKEKLWCRRVAHSSQYYFPKLFQAICKIGRNDRHGSHFRRGIPQSL